MNQMHNFPAKILLFGEYGLIENSKGLTIPYASYQGSLQLDRHEDSETAKAHSKAELQDYADYLVQECAHHLDTEKLTAELDQGLYFKSNIPQGYGVGSSGALVAAIYDRYALDKVTLEECADQDSIVTLKNVLADMESYFHGKSSGIDPLLSYLKTPLLIESKDTIRIAELPEATHNVQTMFLLNSGVSSKTTPMIGIFQDKMKQDEFADKMHREFIPHNNNCIDAFLANKQDMMFDSLKTLSAWSLQHLQPMIPSSLQQIWEDGLGTDAFYLKLCGSGGGGYMLGFTRDAETAKQYMRGHDMHPVLSF